MARSTIALIALYTVLTTTVYTENRVVAAAAAGPHRGGALNAAAAHRRHHARAAAAASAAGVIHFSERDELEGFEQNGSDAEEKRDGGVCDLGAWKCVGTELQRCYNDQWNFVTNCTGINIVCSDALYTTGCVWTWNVQDTDSSSSTSTDSESATVTASGPLETSSGSATDYLNSTASATADVTSSETLVANVTASPTNINLIASPSATTVTTATATTSASTSDEDDEECEDDEQDDNNDDGEDQEDYEDDDDDEDLPYCDEIDGDDSYSTSPASSYATPVVTTTQAASTAVPTSTIGGQLWAGGNGSSDDDTSDGSSNSDSGAGDNDSDGGDTDSADEDEDDEECDEVDESEISVTVTATATAGSASSSASTSVIGGQLWAGDNGDDEEDEGSWDSASATATATATSSSSSAHGWGGQHGWGNGHYGWDQSSTSIAATTTSDWDAEQTTSSSTLNDGQWTPSTSDASATAIDSAGSEVNTTDSAFGSGSAGWGDESYTASSTSSSTGRHGNKWDSETFTATATATISSTLTGSAAVSTSTSKTSGNETTSSPLGSYSAPHYVVYADNWLYNMPSVSDLSSYNRFILAFWMSNQGAVDNAQFWEWLDASTRAQVIEEYHEAGIALMVSAFGSTDSPTSDGADPTETAQKLAEWVKEYGLDGVDIDYEDMSAMNSAKAVSWLVVFQTELRRLLPSPYIITHAPVAPWFTSANDYSDGAYVAIHQQVGDGIDFYNVQFYNQGDGVYGDCDTLLNDSGNDWPSTSVFEINSYAGVPLNKVVIGKPLDEGAASNGFIDPSVLNTCVTEAQAKGWNAGVMFWEWTSSAPSIMATVRGTQ
ncbi:hypothetical protein I317_00129 [Kwoniella heveanensis CBS 569]|nr:hypothetical protein I317_00129 [Kwoniella heveanensis CBS 569]